MRRSLRIFCLGQEKEIQDERVSGFDPHKMDCKFQMVFIPRKCRKRIFGVLRKHLGEIEGQRLQSNKLNV
ncbi:hypothetical protein ATY38_09515 [Nitrosomonas ureae]|nr:hypothetical protein ATY38_09515 [Nitrosomonas ureae]